jgi:hypothetical protein
MSGTLNANYVQADVGANLYLNTGLSSGNVTIGNTSPLIANTISANTVTSAAVTIGTTAIGAGNASTLKNRIINGAMVIDQRNAGASTTPSAGSTTYTLDRWNAVYSVGSKYSVQQNAGSVTPPVGFTNYLGVTSLAATSLGAGDYYNISQSIEGYNAADLQWGTANAKTVTLSFWVRSSLTGTFGGALSNSAQNRNYPFSYTIGSANTWTQISLTIAGDTTGTWLTTNGAGISIWFGLGVGSSYSGTAGSWTATTALSVTGATSVVGTSGATFYITGVQLEVGSSATGYEYRQYGTELQLCQRYYTAKTGYSMILGSRYSISLVFASYSLPVQMRSTPTVAKSDLNWYVFNTTATETSAASTINTVINYIGGNVDIVLNTSFNPAAYIYGVSSNSSTATVTFNAEL